MQESTKTLFLIRHAHRESSSLGDDGISEQGHGQVDLLVQYFQKRFSDESWSGGLLQFESSARVRCVQTLTPLAELVTKPVLIHSGLMEQSSGESFTDFETRIQDYIKEWINSKPPVVLACSHADVLPRIVYDLVGLAIEFKNAGFVELEYKNAQVSIKDTQGLRF